MNHAELVNKIADKLLAAFRRRAKKRPMTYATMVRRIQRTKPSLRLKRGRSTSLSA